MLIPYNRGMWLIVGSQTEKRHDKVDNLREDHVARCAQMSLAVPHGRPMLDSAFKMF